MCTPPASESLHLFDTPLQDEIGIAGFYKFFSGIVASPELGLAPLYVDFGTHLGIFMNE